LINRLAFSAFLAAGLLAAAPVQAQSREPTDRQIESLTALARAALPMAHLEDGSNVPPETPEELAQPIVPRAVEVAIIRRGDLSGQMQHCGLDWGQESYLPLTRRLRANGWRGKKMAYAGLLHGMSQGLTLRELGERTITCDPAKVAALKREAASLSIPAK
jgi:hypothetical protein